MSRKVVRAISLLARRHLTIVTMLLTMLLPAVSPATGLKIVSRNIIAMRRGETITYIQNDRKRVEERQQVPQLLRRGGPFVFVRGPRIVTIMRCDLNQTFVLNLDTREYMAMPIPTPPSKEELQARAAQQPKPLPSQPTLLIETTTEDTGERKQIFGYMARHTITTVKQFPLIETSSQLPQENVTDGWYIDLDTSISCAKRPAGAFALVVGGTRGPGEPPQMPVLSFKEVGKRESGFAVTTKSIHRLAGPPSSGATPGKDVPANEMHVTELSMQPLGDSLFEVPKNFRKVEQIRRTPAFSYWRQLLGWLSYYWARL